MTKSGKRCTRAAAKGKKGCKQHLKAARSVVRKARSTSTKKGGKGKMSLGKKPLGLAPRPFGLKPTGAAPRPFGLKPTGPAPRPESYSFMDTDSLFPLAD